MSQSRHTRVVRTFLASPRDTTHEKAALVRAIENINRVTGRHEGFRIELIHWTTDTYPAVGPDTQSTITSQIGDYDLLIVIFSQQYGTRTPRANSGTEEEYDRAFLRYLQDSSAVRILVYFGNPQVRLHEVDPLALGQLKQFRRRLEKEGVLYQIYEEISEFERLVAVQLTSACREFLLTGLPQQPSPLPSSASEREVIRYPDWIAESRIVLPQSANYFEVDLSAHRRRPISFGGVLRTQSAYFRFGFKLSGLQAPLLGDGSIQTPDPNMVFHIGKNKDEEKLFYTVYRNGRRFGKDHILVDRITLGNKIAVGFSISTAHVIEFRVNDETVHEDRLPSEARDRLAVLMWADEQQCQVEFTDVVLEIDFSRAPI